MTDTLIDHLFRDELVKLAVHEAARSIAAWSLGHTVRRVEIHIVGTRVHGTMWPKYTGYPPYPHYIAIYLSGVMGMQYPVVLRARDPRLYKTRLAAAPARQPALSRARAGKASPSPAFLADDDQITEVLQYVPEDLRQDVFEAGAALAKAAIESNLDLLHRLAQRILDRGTLDESRLIDLRRLVRRVGR